MMVAQRCFAFALTLSLFSLAQCGEVSLRAKQTASLSDKGVQAVLPDVEYAKPSLPEVHMSRRLETALESDSDGASVLIKHLMNKMLETTRQDSLQWIVAAIAFFLGIAALNDGSAIFRSLVVFLCAAAAFIFALSDFQDRWKDGKYGTYFAYGASLEIAAAAGFVAWKGIDGVRYGIGMTIGFLLFQEVKVLAEAKDNTKLDIPLYAIGAGTVCVLFGIFLFSDKMQKTTFGLLAPICGAGAVVSAIGYYVLFGISFLSEATQDKLFKKVIAGCGVKDVPPFEDYVLMLFRIRMSGVQVVGFFEASDSNTVLGGYTLKWDLILGRFFLVIFALYGMYYQCKKDAKLRKRMKRAQLKGPMAEGLIVKRK